MTLLMKPCCECCGEDTPPQATSAMICSFECTFCIRCASNLQNVCPNCRGALAARPPRATHLLDRYPASTNRIVNPSGCDGSEPSA